MDILKKILTFINQFIGIFFTGFWIVLVSVLYIYYQRNYWYVFEYFQYLALLICLPLVGLTVYFSASYFSKLPNWRKWFLTGGGIWLAILLLSTALYCYQFARAVDEIPFALSGLFSFLWINLKVQLALFFVVIQCYVLGNWGLNRLKNVTIQKQDWPILSIGTGVIILSLMSMMIAGLGLFKSSIYLPLGMVSLVLFRKSAFLFVKNTLFTPYSVKQKFSILGTLSFGFLLFWVTINFIGMIKPIPIGFDSLTLYMRLPVQMYDTASLVEGYPPHYWSIFMALGYVLFQETSYVLALSFLGGILALVAFYRVARLWLDANYAYTCLLLFYALPTTNFLAYNDMKIDLGLLFILLCIVLLLVNWIEIETTFLEKQGKDPTLTFQKEIPYSTILLLGVFSGFAIGIKLTALFAIFATLSVFSFIYFEFKGVIATVLLSFFAIIFLGIDQLNGLRSAFLGIETLKWICFVIGLLGLVYFGFRTPHKINRLIRTGFVYSSFLLLAFLPWPIKNYLQSGKTDLNALVYGKFDALILNYPAVQKNWEEVKNK